MNWFQRLIHMFYVNATDWHFEMVTPWFDLKISDRAPSRSALALETGITIHYKCELWPKDNPVMYDFVKTWQYRYSRVTLYELMNGKF